MTTAMQILSVERRRLTIMLMYGIITAEKEFLRSRIFDFLIVSISHRNGLDHTFDHLRLRTKWKQCSQEVTKAWFSERKGVKMRGNDGKNCLFGIRVHEARSSNLRTSTIKARKHHSVLFCFIAVLAVRTPLFACENGVRLAISDTPRARASSEVRLAKWNLCTGA